ncbi:MAG: hypothetical protein ACRYHQ_01530 [Janthinobacterium lividum]
MDAIRRLGWHGDGCAAAEASEVAGRRGGGMAGGQPAARFARRDAGMQVHDAAGAGKGTRVAALRWVAV